MQVCPVAAKTPAITPFATASRSASAKTTWGLLPPSSSVTRLTLPTAACATLTPVAVEPVNATLSMPGCAASASPVARSQAGDDVHDARRQARRVEDPRELHASTRARARTA